MSLKIFLPLVSVYFVSVAAQGLCYSPLGDVREEDSPCFPEAPVSFCCSPYWTCTDNGLCSNQNLTRKDPEPEDLKGYIRGTCTDSEWKSPYCPQVCLPTEAGQGKTRQKKIVYQSSTLTAFADFSDNVAEMAVCDAEKNTFCCRGNPCFSEVNGSCLPAESKMIFSMSGSNKPITTIGVMPPMTTSRYPSTTHSTPPRSTSRNGEAQNSSGASKTNSTIITTDAASREATDGRSNLALKVGLGVGIPVAVVLLGGILLLFLWRERRLRAEISELQRTNATDTQVVQHRPPNYTTMGFPPQELARGQRNSRSRLIAEAPGPERRQRSRQEIATSASAAHELSDRRPSPLPK